VPRGQSVSARVPRDKELDPAPVSRHGVGLRGDDSMEAREKCGVQLFCSATLPSYPTTHGLNVSNLVTRSNAASRGYVQDR
jgi:hypothetical protein